MREKRNIIIILILIIIIVLVGIMFFTKKPRINEPSEDFRINNEKYKLEDNTIYYDAEIINNKKTVLKINKIDITFKDKEGKKIVTITNEIGKNLDVSESISVSAQTKVNTNKKIKAVEYKIY